MNSVDNHSALCTVQTRLTFASFDNATLNSNTQRKRPREPFDSFLSDDISFQVLQQTQQVDQLIFNHAENIRTELLEHQWRRCWTQALAAAEDGMLKRLRAKDEEIDGIRTLNWALEEWIRGLSLEMEIWRELVQTNQAAVVVLQSNLEQVLPAQVGADDAESSCCGENLEEERCRSTSNSARRVCRNYGEGEASVLLLPCRHLCLCSTCGPVVTDCPVCKCNKGAALTVIMD